MIRFEDWTGLHGGNTRIGLERSERVVKVYADSEAELAEWGRLHGLKAEWMDRRRPEQPHYDLFRRSLLIVPPTVRVLTPAEVKERIRAERLARLGKPLAKRPMQRR
ncbi:MAG TPA: hypothetical protein VKT82_33030 [Ktedonobacterales bacterium]|nr:hypothetical protein [Ktedonobacterales bacterium]